MGKTENRFYVYEHIYASGCNKGVAFYIGKGTGTRIYSNSSRSQKWHNIKKKYGIVTRKIKENLTNDEACSLEVLIISLIGIDNLCNFSLGGDSGAFGVKLTDEQKEEKRLIFKKYWDEAKKDPNFVSPNKGRKRSDDERKAISIGLKKLWSNKTEDEIKKYSELCRKNFLKTKDLRRQYWESISGKKSQFYKSDKNWYVHKSGIMYFGDRMDFLEFSRVNKGNLSSLMTGKRKSTGGWRLM